MENIEIILLRNSLHKALVDKLIELYQNEKWKYTFIKNAKEKFNYPIQYKQLSEFEKGNPRNENIINVIILEILSIEKKFTIELLAENNVKVKSKEKILC